MKEALLVIDIDHANGWSKESIDRDPERKTVAESIKKLLDQKRLNDELIIFITYPYNPYYVAKNTQCPVCNVETKDKLASFLEHRCGSLKEPAFVKDGMDAFSDPEFREYIEKQGIRELKIVGCLSDCCVLATAQTAVGKGINVTVVGGCVYPRLIDIDAVDDWTTRAKRFAESPAAMARVI